MAHQTIITESGEELVVLPRREFDVLLARLGDEEAEDRMTGLMVAEHRRLRASGATVVLPDWLSSAMLEGESALEAARKQSGQTLEELSKASGIGEGRIGAIEGGSQNPDPTELEALSRALGVDLAWLSP